MLEKLSIKNLYKIIGSVILAILIFLCVLIFAGKNKKKPEKANPSGKVTDSSMVDESSDKDSSSEDSLSTDDSKTNSKADSSSTADSSAVVTDVQGKVIPTTPSSGGTQPPSGGTTTKTPTGTTTTTTPSTQTMTISLASFTASAEQGITTGLGMPVFEYIFGKETTENGIPTKCIQQRDIVVLKTNQPITKLDFDSSLINATYSGNTITVTATYRSGQYDMKPAILMVNGKYKYKFNIYLNTTYNDQSGFYELLDIYWNGRCGTVITDINPVVTYTNGDVNKSFTKRPINLSNHQFDDTIDFRGGQSIPEVFKLWEFYKSSGFTKVRIRVDQYPPRYLYFCACK